MPKLGEAYVVIRAALKPLKEGLSTARKAVRAAVHTMSATFNILRKHIKRAMIAIAAAMMGGLYAFGKFEAAMRRATAVSDVMHSQFIKMSKMARDQAMRLNIGAHELARGFYFLGSAGLDAIEQIKAFPAVATLAKAAVSDVGTVAEMLVDTMKGFQIAFERTGHVTDVLAKAVISSNMTFIQLGESLSMVSGVARTFNNSLEDTVAAIAAMADVGIKGAKAGMVMRRALLNMAAPMSDVSKLMQQYGIAVYDTSGRMKPFIQLVGEIGERLRGASEEQRNMAFKTIFGARAITGQLAVFDKGRRALREFSDSLRDAGGTAQEIADKQLNSLAEQFGRLRKMVRDIGITIFDSLAPALRKIVDASQEATMALGDWIKEHRYGMMEWSLVVAARINFVRKLMVEFIKFLVTDWPNAWKYVKDVAKAEMGVVWDSLTVGAKAALDTVIGYFKAFGKSLTTIMQKVGTNIANEFMVAGKRAHAKLMDYDRQVKKRLKEMGVASWKAETYGPSGLLGLIDEKKLAEAKRKAREFVAYQERIGIYKKAFPAFEATTWKDVGENISNIWKPQLEAGIERMKAMGKTIADIQKEAFKDIKPPSKLVNAFDRLRKELQQQEAAARKWVDELKKAEQTSKEAADTHRKAMKEAGAGAGIPTGGKEPSGEKRVEFIGLKEMWKWLSSQTVEQSMLSEQKKATDYLGQIEQNTRETIGRLTDIDVEPPPAPPMTPFPKPDKPPMPSVTKEKEGPSAPEYLQKLPWKLTVKPITIDLPDILPLKIDMPKMPELKVDVRTGTIQIEQPPTIDIEAPTIEAPILEMPWDIEFPRVDSPELTVPDIDMPKIAVGFKIPVIDLPDVGAAIEITTPEVTMPDVEVPTIEVPVPSWLKALSGLELEVPDLSRLTLQVDIPAVDALQVEFPQLPELSVSLPEMPEISLTLPQMPDLTLNVPEKLEFHIELPDVPQLVLSLPQIPELTLGLPELPQLTVELPQLPEIPELVLGLPTLPQLTVELPQLPEIPELVLGLPTLPQLTVELPQLPEIPELVLGLPTLPQLTVELPQLPEILELVLGLPTLPQLSVELPDVPELILGLPTMPELTVDMPQFEWPELPTFEVPVLEIPEVEIPEITLPTLDALTVDMPELKAPQIEMPEVGAIDVTMPQIELPSIPSIEVSLPESLKDLGELTVAMPDLSELTLRVDVSTLDALKVELPELPVLKVDMPELPEVRLDVPAIDSLKVEMPDLSKLIIRVDVPNLDALKVEMPELPGLELIKPDWLKDLAVRVDIPKIESLTVDVPKIELPEVQMPRAQLPRQQNEPIAVDLSELVQEERKNTAETHRVVTAIERLNTKLDKLAILGTVGP